MSHRSARCRLLTCTGDAAGALAPRQGQRVLLPIVHPGCTNHRVTPPGGSRDLLVMPPGESAVTQSDPGTTPAGTRQPRCSRSTNTCGTALMLLSPVRSGTAATVLPPARAGGAATKPGRRMLVLGESLRAAAVCVGVHSFATRRVAHDAQQGSWMSAARARQPRRRSSTSAAGACAAPCVVHIRRRPRRRRRLTKSTPVRSHDGAGTSHARATHTHTRVLLKNWC